MASGHWSALLILIGVLAGAKVASGVAVDDSTVTEVVCDTPTPSDSVLPLQALPSMQHFQLDEGVVSEGLVSDADAEDVGEQGNPVAANPPPRDFYKVPNKYTADNMHQCGGTFGMASPTANLEACGSVCKKCTLCQAFVYNDEPFMGQTQGGWCAWQTVVPADPCEAPTCNRDSYALCPSGTWSDGLSDDSRCFAAPHEYVKKVGTANCETAGIDMNCNDGSAQLHVADRDLSKCASMCNSCAIDSVKCLGFVRSTAIVGGNQTDICTFKSDTNTPVNKNEDLYTKATNGTWSDGTMEEGKPAPPGYFLEVNKAGGIDLACNAGLSFYEYGDDGNLTHCSKICDECKVGVTKCMGFIRDSADKKCHFKTEDDSNKFGGEHSRTADAYHVCGKGRFSSGTVEKCLRPDDWIVSVQSGGADDCTCEGRSVGDKRYSSATFTFNFMSGDVPMFVSSKPQVVAPCRNATDCGKAKDLSFRTSGAGGDPTSVRITVDSTDAWCLKRFSLKSDKLQKRWVAATEKTSNIASTLPLWINPGMTDDGQCLPPTTAQPENNWGWCRWVAPGQTSNSTVCHTSGTPQNAYWVIELMPARFEETGFELEAGQTGESAEDVVENIDDMIDPVDDALWS